MVININSLTSGRGAFFRTPACALLWVALTGASAAAGASANGDSQNPPGTPEFSMTAKVIAGGTIADAKSACFDLAATVGQPVTGVSQGANYLVKAGFWGNPWTTDTLFRNAFEDCQP